MEVVTGARSSLPATLRRILAGLLVVLAALTVVIVAHAALSSDLLLSVAGVLGVAFVVLALASALVGGLHVWRSYPQHHRTVVFIVAITVVTLLAHLYIINSPSASIGATVSGVAGTTFRDDQVSVSTSVSGDNLSLKLTATGSNAIAGVSVALAGGGTLPGPGFASPPTFASPLQPANIATGTWILPSSASNSSINVSYQYLTCYSTTSQGYGCIMDEIYYVPEAMGILSGQHCSTNGPNCHMEHPPLVPALVAAGMAVFGEFNTFGWRIFPVLMGTFTLPLFFVIAWKASENKKVAYVSTILLALDVMFFTQSSAVLLDIPETFFGVAAFFAYFANLKFWKFDRYVIAGILLGLSGLAKETAIFFALGVLTYILLFDEGVRKSRIYNAAKVALVLAAVFIIGMQAYDSTLASPAVPTFYQQIKYMLSYGSSLNSGCPWACGWQDPVTGAYITPFSWITYYSPVGYLKTLVTVTVYPSQGGHSVYSYVGLAYYGITNLLETWTVYIWVPLVIYVLYRQFRKAQPSLDQFGFEGSESPPLGVPGEVKFAGLALVWFLWGYLPYIALFFAGRVTYPFYFIPAIPAVALGCGYWVTRSWFPKWLLVLFVVMIFVFFFIYFPDKSFLPDWLRVIIGH